MILDKLNILDLSRDEMEGQIVRLGEPPYRYRQIFAGIYSSRWETFHDFTTLPKALRSRLDDVFTLRSLRRADQIESSIDGTTKFLWQLPDGMKMESVIIYEGKRITFCISSQVGCALGCTFCATGKMGILRDLTAGEIVEQVLHMKKTAKDLPTNIVFMGMGEPMNNYENVMKAADILSDPEGLCFNRKKITISTSGIIPGIYRMADENSPYSLAISLNATTNETRKSIMPVTKKYDIDALMEAARYYAGKTRKRITFEYILIDGLNASVEDAHRLVKMTHGLRCKINAIPSNSGDPAYPPPDKPTIDAFENYLNDHHRTITIRLRKGWEIQAACGQLYAKNETAARKTGRRPRPVMTIQSQNH